MKINYRSIGITILFAGVFLGLLIGGQTLVTRYYVADKFAQQLDSVDGVKKVQINEDEITLEMTQVENFRASYVEIDKILGERNYLIKEKSEPSDILGEIADKSEIAIQEAILRGNFMEMETHILECAKEKGATAKVYVDSDRVYLQLELAKDYKYLVIERPDNLLNVASNNL